MTVHDLSRLHRRYIQLSDRFKASWTFRQFLEGIHKVFPQAPVGQKELDFKMLYHGLKAVSRNLDTTSTDQVEGELSRIETTLNVRDEALLEEDSRVGAGLLRNFFGRVQHYDRKILVQILRFYVHHDVLSEGNEEGQERLDKVDFLLTKFGEEMREESVALLERDPSQLRDALRGLWALTGRELPPEESLLEHREQVESISRRLREIQTLDELNECQLVDEYRSLKRALGPNMLVPEVAQRVIEANLRFREKVATLYQSEERRIAAEYQEVFELERGAPSLDRALDEDLQRFRDEIERFEDHLGNNNVRLEELAFIRNRVRDLIPRLRRTGATVTGEQTAVDSTRVPGFNLDSTAKDPVNPANEFLELQESQGLDHQPDPAPPATQSPEEPWGEDDAAPSRGREETASRSITGMGSLPAIPTGASSPLPSGEIARHADSLYIGGDRPVEKLRIRTRYAEVLGDSLRVILQLLDDTDWDSAPSLVCATPEVRRLRLMPRDVVAFRRLHHPAFQGGDLEQFLLEVAAIRMRISAEAEEIVGLVDQGVHLDQSVFERARATVRLADLFQHRFSHFIGSALEDAEFSEAQTLQYHRMRLLRDHSGLWLLAFG